MRRYLILIVILSYNLLDAQEQWVPIDGVKIKIKSIGLEKRTDSQPLVIFESGLGTPMGNWDKVLSGVAKMAPILAYDRPGIGESEAIDEMPTIDNVAGRLVGILEHLKQEPPYILVGHSLGGMYVRGFANLYPELLAGLVIIDPADFTETKENRRHYYDVLEWPDERVDSLINGFIQQRRERMRDAPLPIQRESEVLEAMRERDFQEINAMELQNMPVHILTGGRFDKPMNLRSSVYDEEKLFRSKMKHRVNRWTNVIQSVDKGMLLYSGDAGHFVHVDDPELLICSIKMVLQDYPKIKE